MPRFVLFLFVLLAACLPTFPAPPANPVAWLPLDLDLPTHTPVTALANDPTNPHRLYAGAYDRVGLYVSEDNGASWRADNAKLPAAPVFALLPDDDELYAGTAAGLYRRAYSAAEWLRADPVPGVAVYTLARGADGELYAATDERGVWMSADDGRSWRRLPGLEDVSLVSILARTQSEIFVGTAGQGLYITHNGGESWSSVPELAGEYVTLVDAHPRRIGILYARGRSGLFRSTDSGQTWAALQGGIEREVINALWFDESSGRMWAAASGGGIFVSGDNGTTWAATQVENPRRRAVLTLAAHNGRLLAGAFDGLLASDDGGASWRVTGRGLGTPVIHDLALDSPRGQLWLATEDGLVQLDAAEAATMPDGRIALNWTALDTGGAPVLSVAIALSDPARVYVGTDGRGVFVSDDGGKSWTAAGGELGGRARVVQLLVDPTDAETVLARVLFERLYKSTDGGDSWRTIWTGMPVEEQLQAAAIAPNDSMILYAGGDTHAFRSTNGGEVWQARGLDNLSTLAVWVDSRDAQRVWAGATDGLYYTANGGADWRGPWLPGHSITALAADSQGILYLGSRDGTVFMGRTDGTDFRLLREGTIRQAPLPEQASVEQLVLDETRRVLYARTLGGLYVLRLE